MVSTGTHEGISGPFVSLGFKQKEDAEDLVIILRSRKELQVLAEATERGLAWFVHLDEVHREESRQAEFLKSPISEPLEPSQEGEEPPALVLDEDEDIRSRREYS